MTRGALAGIPLTAEHHFRVCCHVAAFRLIAHARSLAVAGSLDLDDLLRRHPFLTGHLEETAPLVPPDLSWDDSARWWDEALSSWEATAGDRHLPLVALGATGLTTGERLGLVLCGLVEEDARFGSVFADLQRPLPYRRPTMDTVAAVVGPPADAWTLRETLLSRGLVEMLPGSGPRSEETASVPLELWEVFRGRGPGRAPGAGHLVPVSELDALTDLVLPEELRVRARRLATVLRGASPRPVVVRGPAAGGRRRLVGALARHAGRGALFVDGPALDSGGWSRLGALGAALAAMPVVRLSPLPGQVVEVPAVPGLAWHLGVVVGTDGGLQGAALESAARLDVPAAGPEERREHWRRHLPELDETDLDDVVDRVQLPRGHIRRVAARARDAVLHEGRGAVRATDLRNACRELGRERLDTLAQRLDPPGAGTRLVADDVAREHLLALELRCRHRERVLDHVGPGFGASSGPGVRALLTGPSGTGKTLACRLLAAALDRDLYRVDLSAVVDKYVGETEKNLHRVLSAAEELDVVLLVDEGDSLLGSRTEVRTANDRFANLETDYLLQRLETYRGIVLITTNLPEAIDPAFRRRMDAVLHLVEPGPAQRWELWQAHLPAGCAVTSDHLEQVAARAEMTGGQIRNAALHATLAALEEGEPLGNRHLDHALAVEYGKAGAVSPFTRGTRAPHRRRCETFLEAIP
ncbi:ATP-binding protein [Geodermatophilus sp. SYSU D01062]